jgi:glycosyltransferase involved in cell wall biosynthesis
VEELNKRLVQDGHKVTSIPLSIIRPVIEQQYGQQRVTHGFTAPNGEWFEQKLRLIDVAIDAFLTAIVEPVDLIHSHDWLAGKTGSLLSEKLKCPHITTIHTLTELQRQAVGLPGILPAHAGQIRLEKELCSSPDAIISVSHDMARKICAAAPGPVPDIDVIPNGITVSSHKTPSPTECSTLRRKLAPEGGPIILYVGRLAPQKGVDFLLASSFAVRDLIPDARWVIVGDHIASHMMRPAYEKVLQDGGARDHIHFLGEIPHHEIELYYRVADCLVVPSLFEGCPYVVLEAMQIGVPVIASDLPCFREILTDRETALLVPCDEFADTRGPDVKLLAQAQLELLGNTRLANAMITTAANAVRNWYPMERQHERTLQTYRRFVDIESEAADASQPGVDNSQIRLRKGSP